MGFIREGGNWKWFGECPICHTSYRGIRKSQKCKSGECSGFVEMVNLNAKATMRDIIILKQKIECLERKISGAIPILVERLELEK